MIDTMSGGRRRSRRGSLWFGIGLIAAGVAMLGYVAWQFFGTNIVSERRQQEAVAALQEAWRETAAPREGGTTGKDRGGPGRAAAAAASVPLGSATALVRVPRFGDDYVMPVFEGVADDVLSKGYGHFAESADAGDKGNFALAAHRVTHGEPLRDMPSLRPGDEVIVETRTMVYTYELDTDPNDLVVTFRDVWVVDEQPVNPSGGVGPVDHPRLLTLTTCAELFHTDDRMIAFGHLVSAEEKDLDASS